MINAVPHEPHEFFEKLYNGHADPYGVRTRWYEQRKRALLLVLATDFSAQALSTARQRTSLLHQVRIEQHVLPQQWPTTETFDLIVLSEVLYFLPIDAVRSVARHCAASLTTDGVLVACDWRPDFDGRACATDTVHAVLGGLGLHHAVAHEDNDFCLKLWTRDPRSVAQREGIRD